MSRRQAAPLRVSARLRLALGYAVFLVAAGAILLFGLYVVLRYVPDYPLTAANPRDTGAAASRQEILEAVAGVSVIALVALGIIGFVGGWFLAESILRPLRHINDAARIAATGDLHHRIGLAGRNDEFRQLADNFDLMLDRLREAFEMQERFAANASHELRTPLAVTATVIDVALRDPREQDYPAVLERLRITNDRAVALIDSLLRLADANAVTAAAVPVDLSGIVRSTIEENAGEADRRGVTVTSQLDDAVVTGDPGLLAQLATNLVQNAIRHSGSDGRARIVTRRGPALGTVALRIESTGSVVSAETAATLIEPFLRGAGRIASGDRGHGLGLPLVHRIAELHGGFLRIAPRNEGGLIVTVELPDDGVPLIIGSPRD